MTPQDSVNGKTAADEFPPSDLRILVAEDNEINRKVIQIVLERMGHPADYVETGQEVLEALKYNHYDLILMDMLMPVMDGIEATRQIHRDFADGGRPIIIAMTASAMPEDERKCLEAGMDDYISKPFKIETVQSKIEGFFPGFARPTE
ncbi:response regulator [Gorillibacterium massiliense]|uniref:response regulator n=1 Tax=Gorillibacterium massiliense TaxID=1280390 RepID=UPI0004B2A933|nr:response regulator [Gorillibacterium massiliense]